MNYLYLLKNYSNYFNRKVKYRATLSEYIDGLTEGEDYFILPNTNFNPNDGVSTSHIIGSANRPYTPEWQPDYCLVIEWLDGGEPRIVSRWFVTEFVRTMANQYSVALKRDTPSDKYNVLIQAPCYIEKATLPDNSPLIVNSEGMNLNQTKVVEYLLRDKSKVPWVVVYLAHNAAKDGIEIKTNIPKNIPDIETDTSAEGQLMRRLFLQNENFIQDSNNIILMDINMDLYIRTLVWFSAFQGNNFYQVSIGRNNSFLGGWINGIGQYGGTIDNSMTNLFNVDESQAGTVYAQMNTLSMNLEIDYQNFFNYIKSQAGDINASEKIDHDIPRLTRGKIWRYGQNYYELIEEQYDIRTREIYLNTSNGDYLDGKFRQAFSNRDVFAGDKKLRLINARVKYVHYRLQLKQGINASLDIKAGRIHPEEVPYDIIAFPYEPIYVNGSGWNKNVDDVASLAAARSIAVELAQGCYDVQMLPYCPVLDQFIGDDGEIYLGDAVENVDYCVVKEGGVNKTLGFYAHSVYQSLNVNKLFDGEQEFNVRDICRITGDGRKVDNECDMWRLCAPNWTSQFEFKMSKVLNLVQGAEMDHFDVDITYRPYQPYIRVAPQFGFLYVTDYKDARGLICTTGFSITLIDDKWQTYELNNKNYQNMFNREIQGMEVSRAIAREQEQWNISQAWTNAITGMVGGGIAGFLAGEINPLAGIGVGLGAINRTVSAGMKVADAYKQAGWAERAYQENRDFKLDMFNMSLDNIKALPSSITQSSSISYNFKFFPVLEKYTCTDKEREMIKDKLKWNGMTVGLISAISGYISDTEERYIQGELIRLDDLGEDSHLANDLYNEVKKGLFFEPYIIPNKEVK